MSTYSFPKIELHLHLDGSFRMETIWRLAQEKNIPMPASSLEEYKAFIHRCSNADSVNEYLKMFEAPLQVMQDVDTLVRITFELIEDLANQGIRYAEIRFAPQLHTKQGLSQEEVLKAILEGRRQALEHYPMIKIGIITCMMSLGLPSLNELENLETIELCRSYLGKGVVALDLAGAEGIVPLNHFQPLFNKAKEYNLPCTCHAGDSQAIDSIWDAFQFGVRRIGHGHHLLDDLEACQVAKEKDILLEICPTSNIQCKTVSSYQNHPMKALFDLGVPISINTDNMTLANVNLDQEYDHCLQEMGFTIRDIIQMNLQAIHHAFLSEEEKQNIIQELEEALEKETIC